MQQGEKKEIFIKESAIFQDLNQQELAFVSGFLIEKTFEPGQEVLQQGKSGSALYVIESGEFEISVTLPGNIKDQIGRLEKNHFFGEVTLLSESPVTATVTAQKKARCYILSKETLNMFRLYHSEIAYKIENSIAYCAVQRICKLIDRIYTILSHVSASAEEKSLDPFRNDKNAKFKKIDISYVDPHTCASMRLFYGFHKEDWEQLFHYIDLIAFDLGFEIDEAKFKSPFIGIVYSGAIQITLSYGDALIKTMAVAGPGEMFKAINFFSSDEKRMKVVTREKTVALMIPEDKLKKLMNDHPFLWHKMHHVLCANAVGFLYAIDRQLIRIESEYDNVRKPRESKCAAY